MTGVQTCALPICEADVCLEDELDDGSLDELVEEYLMKHGYSIVNRDG